jgi:hypothetical protein
MGRAPAISGMPFILGMSVEVETWIYLSALIRFNG